MHTELQSKQQEKMVTSERLRNGATKEDSQEKSVGKKQGGDGHKSGSGGPELRTSGLWICQ